MLVRGCFSTCNQHARPNSVFYKNSDDMFCLISCFLMSLFLEIQSLLNSQIATTCQLQLFRKKNTPRSFSLYFRQDSSTEIRQHDPKCHKYSKKPAIQLFHQIFSFVVAFQNIVDISFLSSVRCLSMPFGSESAVRPQGSDLYEEETS